MELNTSPISAAPSGLRAFGPSGLRIGWVSRRLALLSLSFACLALVGCARVRGWSAPDEGNPTTGSGPTLLRLQNPTSLSLGSGRPGDTKKAILGLKNEGETDLTVRLEHSCGCASLSPAYASVRPGEEFNVEVSVKLRHEGQEERVLVRAFAENGGQLLLECMVSATCDRLLTISPPTLDFGRIPVHSQPKLSLRITDRWGRPFSTSGAPVLRPSSTHVVIERSCDGRTDEFTVSLQGLTGRGSFYGDLMVTLPDEDYCRVVPVSAELVGTIETSPSSLYFPAVSVKKEGSRQATLFVWRNDKLPLGHLVSHDAPAGVTIDDAVAASRRYPELGAVRRRLGVSLDPGFTLREPISISLRFAEFREPVTFSIVPFNSQARPDLQPLAVFASVGNLRCDLKGG